VRCIQLQIGVLALLFLLTGGCDGTYIYSYQGTIYRHDGVTPAANIPMEIASVVPKSDPDWQSNPWAVKADQTGHFTGSFSIGAGWIFALRPSASKLERVFLLTPSTQPIEIPLADIDQPTTPEGRRLVLPPVTLPADAR
jgi:hypothetical protein